MEITITSESPNVLLNRKELKFSIKYTGTTPSRKEVHAKLAAMLNSPKEQLVIGTLCNKFGMTFITGDARAYDSREALKKVEAGYILKRGMNGEEETGADAQDAPSGDAAEAS
jgi:small subunit ribosomal protein S24e